MRLLRTILQARVGTIGELGFAIGSHGEEERPTDLFSVKTPEGFVVVRRDEIEEVELAAGS